MGGSLSFGIDRRRCARPLSACLLAAALALPVLAGCVSPTLYADVTTFHRWQSEEPRTFSFRRTPAQRDSLEHASYEALVATRLRALGFAPAAAARYEVALDYSVSSQLQRITEYPPYPAFGPPWPHPYPGWRGVGWYDPWYWGPPMIPMVRDVRVERYLLRVDLFDTRPGAPDGGKVFEASASAVDGAGGLPAAMPALVEAVLGDFPGRSGTTRSVAVPLAAPR